MNNDSADMDTIMNVDNNSVHSDDQYVDNNNIEVDNSFSVNAIQIVGDATAHNTCFQSNSEPPTTVKQGRTKEQRLADSDSDNDSDNEQPGPAAKFFVFFPQR